MFKILFSYSFLSDPGNYSSYLWRVCRGGAIVAARLFLLAVTVVFQTVSREKEGEPDAGRHR